MTCAQLAAIVDRLAVGLIRLGVRRGEAPVMRCREVEFMTRLTGSPRSASQTGPRIRSG